MNAKNIVKSVGAILAGAVIGAALSITIDTVIESTGVVPSAADQLKYGSPTWFLVLATVYRCLFTALSGYVTARLSPSNPRRHIYILGTIALLANLGGGIAMWSFGQHWYPALLTILALPSALWGGAWFYGKRTN